MELDSEFIRLPLQFDVNRLSDEVRAFSEQDWRKHPQGHVGNTALPLVACEGDPDNDSVRGRMRPTPYLERSPYLQQVLGSLNTVIGRTRLMRIEGNGEATLHTDTNYYWMNRVRVHIPVITFPEVDFICGDMTINMPAGECWIFDTWRMHNVLNHRPEQRIHLVSDTVGTVDFWELVRRGDRPGEPAFSKPSQATRIPFDPARTSSLIYESVNFPIVMSPGEQDSLAKWLLGQLVAEANDPIVVAIQRIVTKFQLSWRALWAQFGTSASGTKEYQAALSEFDGALQPHAKAIRLRNGSDLVECLRQALIRPALNLELAKATVQVAAAEAPKAPTTVVHTEHEPKRQPAPSLIEVPTLPQIAVTHENQAPRLQVPRPQFSRNQKPASRFDRPVFIVSAPRSGSTLLFETLSRSPSVFTIGGESHGVIEGLPQLSPASHGWHSNRLLSVDADEVTAEKLRSAFFAQLRDRDGKSPADSGALRFLEKTPKNALRIPFIQSVFPGARFIYLVREPQEAVSSILEAWRSGKFVTYREIPGWKGPWSLLLIPGWRDLIDRPLNETAAAQWETTNRIIQEDLAAIPADHYCTVSYRDLIQDPQSTIETLCQFAGLEWDVDLRETALPPARHTLTPPMPEKWKRNAAEIEPILPGLRATALRAQQLLQTGQPTPMQSEPPATPIPTPHFSAPAADSAKDAAQPAAAENAESPLKSQHTSSFPKLLDQLGVSLMITTYQAGQVVLARVDEQGRLNTHFRKYPSPMGLAADRGRLAIGTKQHVWTLQNQPDLGKSIDPRFDACYATRSMHVTGDIRIHEIGWGSDDLWIVNTRFSCLCTLDPKYSFVPRWRPSFITEYTPNDRCHLNGMAIVDGKPKYCTALGATDSPGGWRENKPSGGILLDVESNEIIARGLCMPHSPRIYRDRFWFLNSGEGGLNTLDLATGKVETIATLPGFTRGLAFYGDFAFIGLSQVRETAVFSGLPITEQEMERKSGVWVVDLRTGRSVGFLHFTEKVQEIFAIQVLEGVRFPEIVADEDQLTGAFVLPPEALSHVPQSMRGPKREPAPTRIG